MVSRTETIYEWEEAVPVRMCAGVSEPTQQLSALAALTCDVD